ncbi:hypothetical protein [Lysobacter gummosus]
MRCRARVRGAEAHRRIKRKCLQLPHFRRARMQPPRRGAHHKP